MLKCLIVDDEPLAVDVIAEYIPKIPFLHLSASYNNGVEALMHLKKEKIDLIFLDIQMPQLTGLQFMNLLQSRSQVIIVSAYNEFAMDGYEHDVTDYLLKPVSFERFYRGAEKAQRFAELSARESSSLNAEFIFVRADNRMIKVNFADILYIEGLKNYISIYTHNNKRIITLQNMKTLEDLLPANRFIRVQKSYIVNVEKIDAIERQRILIGDKVIPIGEAYAPNFFSFIGSTGR
ncbi:MAG TPA: LytTR family DNA-binding domain-containing protein [Chitinophagaceae bacterium]|nr:LytTR family DNA-binding domain-containing protein [Chitinophagaceae bacterium]